MFNTLQYTKKLEAAGVTREQAEAHIQIIADLVEGDLVTKQDIRELESRLIIKLTAILGTIVTATIAIVSFILKSS